MPNEFTISEITTREPYSGFPILQGGVKNFYDVYKIIDGVEK